jgi:hypothetical protein
LSQILRLKVCPKRTFGRFAVIAIVLFSQVIPEGAGPVKRVGRPFFLTFDVLAGASM